MDSPVSAYDAAAELLAESMYQQAYKPGPDNAYPLSAKDSGVYFSYYDSARAGLDKLLAAREHTTCPECGGTGHHPDAVVSECQRPSERSEEAEHAVQMLKEASLRKFAPCPNPDCVDGSVPGGSLLLAVMVEKGLA